MAEVVPKAVGRAEAKVEAADAEAEAEAVVEAKVVAAGRVMAKGDADDGVEAEAGSVRVVPTLNPSKTVTFPVNQGKGCWNFIRMDTASYGAPKTTTPANVAIHLFLER